LCWKQILPYRPIGYVESTEVQKLQQLQINAARSSPCITIAALAAAVDVTVP